MVADVKSGWLEGFLTSICYSDRQSAERARDRVTQIVREQFDGNLPASFNSETHERPDDVFDLEAEYFNHHGQLQRVM
jgi:hypothetical protein